MTRHLANKGHETHSRYHEILKQFKSRHRRSPEAPQWIVHPEVKACEDNSGALEKSFSHTFPGRDKPRNNDTLSLPQIHNPYAVTSNRPNLMKKDRSKSEPSLLPSLGQDKGSGGVRSFPGAHSYGGGKPTGKGRNKGRAGDVRLPRFDLQHDRVEAPVASNTPPGRPSEKRKCHEGKTSGFDWKKPRDNLMESVVERAKREKKREQQAAEKRGKQRPGQQKQQQQQTTVKLREMPAMPFSIRKKIEQYRLWHEEQYTKKLDELKQEAQADKAAVTHKLDNAPVTELTAAHHDLDESRPGEMTLETLARVDARAQKHEQTDSKGSLKASRRRTESPSAPVPRELKERVHTAKTWRTWRDPNTSYAYYDVKAYIKENELMPKEKESRIRKWLVDVRAQPQAPEHAQGE